MVLSLYCSVFQSTLPLRGVTRQTSLSNPFKSISIHTPLAGSDLDGARLVRNERISIHTPLAGSDAAPQASTCPELYFNPHSPCGE